MKAKSGNSAGTTSQHKQNRSERMNNMQNAQPRSQNTSIESQGTRGKQHKTVQINGKLRQHSNNNSVNLHKPLNEGVDLSLERLAAPGIINNSIDKIGQNLLVQPEIAKIANEISRSSHQQF